MIDRFKFRVWDKRLYRYIGNNDPTQMLLENGNLAYLDDDGMKFYEVEFCTGLKDKNGKLIYEGDLIKEPANKHNLEVFYENGAWQTREYRKNGNREQLLYVLINCYGVEVIGNIHENADLIKVGGK